MTPAPLHLSGERVMLDPAGVLSWPARRLLIVSDLHLEKGSHLAARGAFLPPYDTRDTLARLALALRRHGPERLLLLGDSFHDPGGHARMAAADREMLGRLLSTLREVIWILGNHDPSPPEGLPGRAAALHEEGPLAFRHEAAGRAPPGEVSGHFHPKATVETRAGGVTRACFVSDGRRLVLPAFGAYAGGLDVRDPAVSRLFPRGGRVFLLGRERLHSAPLPAARRSAA